MSKIKIAAVSYVNTLPFIRGIQSNKELSDQIELILDHPAGCAQRLMTKNVDMALVPVAIIPDLKISFIVSKYCIAAEKEVKSVILVSDVPLSELKSIYLDDQSRTSALLIKILARKYWRIMPQWQQAVKGYEKLIVGSTGGLIIGDRAMNRSKNYRYVFDLSEEWNNFTNLPFVFAAWVAIRPMTEGFKELFNVALRNGIEQIPQIIEELENAKTYGSIDIREYLTQNLSFELNDNKVKGMNLFLKNSQEQRWKEQLNLVNN